MVRIRAIGEMYIEITGLMATFWACSVIMKCLCQYQTNSSFSNELIAVILCYIVIPLITLVNIINRQFAKVWRKSQILQNSKILLFTIIEVSYTINT